MRRIITSFIVIGTDALPELDASVQVGSFDAEIEVEVDTSQPTQPLSSEQANLNEQFEPEPALRREVVDRSNSTITEQTWSNNEKKLRLQIIKKRTSGTGKAS